MDINIKHQKYSFRRIHARISGFGPATFLDIEHYGEKPGLLTVVEQPVIAYLLEALREHVQKEAADKLLMGYSDGSGSSRAVIPCIESDL